MKKFMKIDGKIGEGGGQVLRTALSLSAITNTPIQINNIRGGRQKKGLLRQHLTCVNAAAKICNAEVFGATLGSQNLEFRPDKITAGNYRFSINSAGSTSLVLQTVLPILMHADAPSSVQLAGGTHNQSAPSADFIAYSFAPALSMLGIDLQVNLKRPGFYPAGGGEVQYEITPFSHKPFPLKLTNDSEVHSIEAHAVVSNLPDTIASKELNRIAKRLPLAYEKCHWKKISGTGPGNVVAIHATRAGVQNVFTGFGRIHKHNRKVADEAVDQFIKWRESGAVVCEHLADQLLIPMSLLSGGKFTTTRPTMHTLTNMEIIAMFLNVDFTISELTDQLFEITVSPEYTWKE